MPKFEIVGFNSYARWARNQGFIYLIWSFLMFFRVFHQKGNKFFTLNQAFISKKLGKPSCKTFPMVTRSKTSFITSTTAVNTQQILKIQSKLFVKPKIIQSVSLCKNHLINLLDSSNPLCDASDFRVSCDLEGLTHFWAYPSNNYQINI